MQTTVSSTSKWGTMDGQVMEVCTVDRTWKFAWRTKRCMFLLTVLYKEPSKKGQYHTPWWEIPPSLWRGTWWGHSLGNALVGGKRYSTTDCPGPEWWWNAPLAFWQQDGEFSIHASQWHQRMWMLLLWLCASCTTTSLTQWKIRVCWRRQKSEGNISRMPETWVATEDAGMHMKQEKNSVHFSSLQRAVCPGWIGWCEWHAEPQLEGLGFEGR